MKLHSVRPDFKGFLILVLISISNVQCASMGSPHFGNLRLSGDFRFVRSVEGRREFTNDRNEILWIEEKNNFSLANFRDYVNGKSKTLSALSQPWSEPYYGVREPGPTCAEKNRPASVAAAQEAAQLHMVHLYATDGFVYGACSESADTLRSQLIWLYCLPSGHFFELRYFYSAMKPWVLTPVGECA